MKQVLKNISRRIFELNCFRFVPRGLDPFHNLSRFLPNWNCTTVFDVGANVGQSALTFYRRFPEAHIHAFEPFPSTFEELRWNTSKLSRISIYAYALSSSAGKVFGSQGDCSTNNIITKTRESVRLNDKEVQIQTRTISQIFDELNLTSLSFLKIDTEGHDLEVLRGASELLDQQMIDVIYVESGMNPTNKLHVSFESIKYYLESKNYFVFGLYEQTFEFMSGYPAMRRCNAMFISSKLNEENCIKV